MDVHQCNKVDFPCCSVCRCMTTFHSLSTATFASGINIAWSERSFIHSSRCPEASVSAETDLQNCLIHSQLSVSQYPYFVCVYTSRISGYTRDSLSRSASGVNTSFFPGSQPRNSAIVGCARWNDHAKSEVQRCGTTKHCLCES